MRAMRPDGVTDRAIEAREQVLAAAADEDSAEGEEGAESRVRLSKTNRYDFGVVSAATHKSMQGNKRRDTKPEVLVRRMLREMGFPGYRCDWRKRLASGRGVRGAQARHRDPRLLLASVSRVQPVGAQEEPRLLGG